MGEVNITPSPRNRVKISKSLSFVGKENFSKSVGIKCNHENMMNNNDAIFFHHGKENEGTCFLDNSLNKSISRKKVVWLLNEESSSHFEVF